MPTLVLNHKKPFECLLKSNPDYTFLRTFRCLCFPFLRPYNAYKLDFHLFACVFLGYSNSYLGYWCLDLSSKHIYLARYVWFHENVFPFDKSEQIVVPPTQPSTTTQPVTLHLLTTPSQVLPPMPPTLPTPSSAPLPLTIYYYHDHSSSAGSDFPHSHVSSITPSDSPSFSPIGSYVMVVSPTVSLASSPS